jgi:hypothetical protein
LLCSATEIVMTTALARIWLRLPVVVRAVMVGSLVLIGGILLIGPLVLANLTLLPAVPWSVPLLAAYVWCYWQYLRGRWPAASTAESALGNAIGLGWIWWLSRTPGSAAHPHGFAAASSDPQFWMTSGAALVFAVATVWAFRRLAEAARSEPAQPSVPVA